MDRLLKRLQPEARARMTSTWSSMRAGVEQERDATATWLRGLGQADAAATLLREWDDLVTFYDLPADHWRHLRRNNAVESLFAWGRLRTDVAKRAESTRTRSISCSRSWSAWPAPGTSSTAGPP